MVHKKNNEKIIKNVIYFSIITVISLVLTIPSMELIKKVPGNSFSSDAAFIATALLVFLAWFALITLCVWLLNYLINSKKLKKNPSDKNAKNAVTNQTKKFKILAKILKWLLIAAAIYFIIVFLSMVIVFSFGPPHR